MTAPKLTDAPPLQPAQAPGRPIPITSDEWLTLAREAEHRAIWQISELNSDRLFARADMLKGLARRQGQVLGRPKKARRDSDIRVWRSWDEVA
jgi:hypothetical protein